MDGKKMTFEHQQCALKHDVCAKEDRVHRYYLSSDIDIFLCASIFISYVYIR